MYSVTGRKPISRKFTIDWSNIFKPFAFVIFKPNLFRTDFLYAHKPRCYTRFHTLQPLEHTFLIAPWRGHNRLIPSRLQLSLCSLYFHLLTQTYQPVILFSQAMNTITYSIYCYQCTSIKKEMYLPAHFNNIMNKYKATMHSVIGRRPSISAQEALVNFNIQGSSPSVINGFMATTYCFLISTAKSLPQFVCGANPHIILALEINSTLHLLVRQRLPLSLPTY